MDPSLSVGGTSNVSLSCMIITLIEKVVKQKVTRTPRKSELHHQVVFDRIYK